MNETEFRDKYKERARNMRVEDLPQFLGDLQAEDLDYGTVCIAIALAGNAAMWAIEHSPQGGITGFQAGCIGWEILRLWDAPALGECGAKLTVYDNMLYPLYERHFTEHVISNDSWLALQKKAAELLAGDTQHTSDNVIAHWQSIVAGKVPFGYVVEEA